jgi:hypothetical protein
MQYLIKIQTGLIQDTTVLHAEDTDMLFPAHPEQDIIMPYHRHIQTTHHQISQYNNVPSTHPIVHEVYLYIPKNAVEIHQKTNDQKANSNQTTVIITDQAFS